MARASAKSLTQERRTAFGKALDAAMDARKVSARELSRHLDMSHAAILNWLEGVNQPSCDDVFAMEQFFQMPAGYLSVHLGYGPPIPPALEYFDSRTALLHDPLLDESGRQILVAGYDAAIARRSKRNDKRVRRVK